MSTWRDPIVEEVRRVRRELEVECGGDAAKLREHALRVQQQVGGRIVNRGPVRLSGRSGTDAAHH